MLIDSFNLAQQLSLCRVRVHITIKQGDAMKRLQNHWLKPIAGAGTLMAAVMCAPAALADTYLGLSAGQSQIEYGSPDTSTDFDPKAIDLDDGDTAFKVFGGYKFTIAAAELAYVDFGRIEGNNGTYSEVSGFSGFGMLHMGLGPASVFGKVGGFMWESTASVEQLEDDGYDLAYGLGVMVGLLGIDARMEYEYFNVGGKLDDVSMVSVGVSYSF